MSIWTAFFAVLSCADRTVNVEGHGFRVSVSAEYFPLVVLVGNLVALHVEAVVAILRIVDLTTLGGTGNQHVLGLLQKLLLFRLLVFGKLFLLGLGVDVVEGIDVFVVVLELLVDEFVKLVFDVGRHLDLVALGLSRAFEVAEVSALHALEQLELARRGRRPFLETATLAVADVPALITFNDIILPAVLRLVAALVALKAHFLVALKRVVGVLSAEDAVEPLGVVRAVFFHVAELKAVVALEREVLLGPVPLARLHVDGFLFRVDFLLLYDFFLGGLAPADLA